MNASVLKKRSKILKRLKERFLIERNRTKRASFVLFCPIKKRSFNLLCVWGTKLKFDLEKLKDPNVLETFQALIGGMSAPLIIMNNEDADVDSVITIFKTAVTETAIETLGKRQKKKPWVTAEILDLCNKRRELRYKDSNLKDLRYTRK